MSLITRSTLLVVSSLLVTLPALRAADAPPNGAPESTAPAAPGGEKGAPRKKRPNTELEDRMDEMGAAFKKLRRQIADATKNAESLELVGQLKTAAEKAAKLKPAKTADVPENEQAKFLADYQAEMKSLVDQLGQLEAALKANANAQAEKLLKDLGAMQRKDHKLFQRPQS